MALENLVGNSIFITNLVPSNPETGDPVSEGDDHLRGIKNAVLNSFPNVDEAVTATPDQLNGVSPAFTGIPTAPTAADGTNTTQIATTEFVQTAVQDARLASGTAIAASGTQVNFTGIPSWAKRITVMLSGVSTTGTSRTIIQLGTSGGVEATGYLGSSTGTSSAAVSSLMSTGFLTVLGSSGSAADTFHGLVTICNVTSTTWVASGVVSLSNTALTNPLSGTKALSGVLDRIRITTVNGTDTFDAGTINLFWE